MFSEQDKNQIISRGSDIQVVENQLERFRTGFPYAKLVKAATATEGIKVFSPEEKTQLAVYFDEHKEGYSVGRFVPASGAATRMFKSLYGAMDKMQGKSEQQQEDIIAADSELASFFQNIHRYPFFEEIDNPESLEPLSLLRTVLETPGLNYGSLPKGLIKFHTYQSGSRTAYEEHLHEMVRMMLPAKEVHLHFTVSQEHQSGFKDLENTVIQGIEKKYGVNLDISYSFQKKQTDTIAVDLENMPFRNEDGSVVFRPGGHGALIENLNDLDVDIAYLNNIDNVSPDSNSELRVLNKKMLGGLLMKLLDEMKLHSKALDSHSQKAISDAEQWLKLNAHVSLPDSFSSYTSEEKVFWLKKSLNRPLRIAGMVKNEGEPGGGPFFVENSRGELTPQIVEPSQVDESKADQMDLFKGSSHFNPVDLVCSLKNLGEEAFNLRDFVDAETGFISSKSVKGKDLKALELPGLWNGSMAGWITVFVEIPEATFTPVKTIFDLLRPSHINIAD